MSIENMRSYSGNRTGLQVESHPTSFVTEWNHRLVLYIATSTDSLHQGTTLIYRTEVKKGNQTVCFTHVEVRVFVGAGVQVLVLPPQVQAEFNILVQKEHL